MRDYSCVCLNSVCPKIRSNFYGKNLKFPTKLTTLHFFPDLFHVTTTDFSKKKEC